MKKMIKLLLILVMSGITPYLQAQLIDPLTPDNIQEVTDQIFDLYGGQIDASSGNIEAFLEQLVPSSSTDPGYDPSCEPPVPEAVNYFLNEVSFDWDDSPNPSAVAYNVSFFKLNDITTPGGEFDFLQTTTSDISFDVSDGLVIVVFQTVCASSLEAVGKGKVIITDKPVYAANNVSGECECRVVENSNAAYFMGGEPGDFNDFVYFPYTHDGQVGTYVGDFLFANGDEAKFSLQVSGGNGDPILIGKINGCMINIDNDPGESTMYIYTPESQSQILGVISFGTGFFFNPMYGVAGNFYLDRCGQRGGNGGHGGQRSDSYSNNQNFSDKNEFSISSFPNPAKNQVSFIVPDLELDEAYDYSILDVLGNPVSILSENFSFSRDKLQLDIKHLSAGTYYLVAQNKYKVMKTRFVKVN